MGDSTNVPAGLDQASLPQYRALHDAVTTATTTLCDACAQANATTCPHYTCSICFDSITLDDVLARLDCGHIYHCKCFFPMQKPDVTRKCALCRASFTVFTVWRPRDVPPLRVSKGIVGEDGVEDICDPHDDGDSDGDDDNDSDSDEEDVARMTQEIRARAQVFFRVTPAGVRMQSVPTASGVRTTITLDAAPRSRLQRLIEEQRARAAAAQRPTPLRERERERERSPAPTVVEQQSTVGEMFPWLASVHPPGTTDWRDDVSARRARQEEALRTMMVNAGLSRVIQPALPPQVRIALNAFAQMGEMARSDEPWSAERVRALHGAAGTALAYLLREHARQG